MTESAAKLPHVFCFRGFTLDLDRGGLVRGTEEVKLRPKVFDALRYLVLNNNRLVTKDELIRALWTDTFVSDDSLVQCLVELRRALGDDAQACLRTVPRRGYIFIAEVSDGRPAGPAPAPGSGRTRRVTVALAAAAAAALAVSYATRDRAPARGVAFTDKDSVLIADFVNTTGDEVFDGTLARALAVQLAQSPFVNVFPEERVRETLRYMERPPTEPVTRELAREVAQRQGVKAVLLGSIASLGSHYVVNLEALSAATGETLALEQAEAESRERVLGRLGEAAVRLRPKLGESLASLEKFAAPIEQATTASLEAFKAYDLARHRQFSGRYFEAIPLYRRAVELDPDFAIAYAALAVTHGTAQEYDQAARFSQRAFALRDRVSERERFYISTRYYMDVLGDSDRAIETLELWKQTYPRDFVPPTNLAVRYCAIGRHQRALEEARESIRLNPDAGVAYASVALGAICLGRYQEARDALEQAAARKLDAPYGHNTRFALAFLEGDAAGMQQQVDRVAGTPSEAGMLAVQSVAAAYRGQVRRARDLNRKAVDLALARGLKEGAAQYSAGGALWEAAYGDCRAARQTASRTLALARGRHALSWSALATALCGDPAQAQPMSEEMARRFPRDWFFKTSWLPMIHAAAEIKGASPARALQLLQPAERGELGTDSALWPAYLRGLAQLERGAAREAQAEFQKVLDHQGVLAPQGFNPVAMTLYPLARLGRARAAAHLGDVEGSRREYEALLALWEDADPDVPALQAAQREYRRLSAAPRS
jgi:eukaryotic-like serine/threonine-protein kinase